jgi:hypothetical protein
MVGHKERVKAAAFERLREALQMREVEVGVRVSWYRIEGARAP